MAGESDGLSRAGSFVLGLMNEADRQRAERDLEVDPVFREAVLEFAERLQVLDVVPQKGKSDTEQWKLVAAWIADMPQMRGIVEGAIEPPGEARNIGRGPEQFQEKREPVFRPELRDKEIEQFQEKREPVLRPELRGKEIAQFQRKGANAPYAVPSWQATVYAISLIVAFAAGCLAALWLM